MKKAFLWSRVILWCGIIFYFSSIPDLKIRIEGLDFILRKIAHAFVYGILYLFVRETFTPKSDSWYYQSFYSAVFSIIYALTDEFHQGLVPGRYFSFIDIAIDTAGVLFFMYMDYKKVIERSGILLKNVILRRSFFCRSIILIIIISSVTGCANYEISRLDKLVSKGKVVDAAVGFERFALKNPTHPQSVYALFRAADIYNYSLQLPSKAAAIYRQIEENYHNQPILIERARQGLLRSPDYMPLLDGAKWIEGDSVSGGANMRATWTSKEISTGCFLLEKKFTTGGANPRAVATKKLYYIFKEYTLFEKTSPDAVNGKILLEYPIYHGKKWRYYDTSANVWVNLDLEFVPGIVEVRAGKFSNCIRIGERTSTGGVVKYDYYAPYVGWILTTVSGTQMEHRNSELLSYQLPY